HSGQATELPVVEAGAGVSHVLEGVAHADPEEERAEVSTRATRLGETAHDEIGALDELDLAPVGVPAARGVGRVAALGDEAFAALPFRPRVQLARIAGNEFTQPEGSGAVGAEDPLEAGAACHQRQRPEVLAPIAEDIEGDEGGGLPA